MSIFFFFLILNSGYRENAILLMSETKNENQFEESLCYVERFGMNPWNSHLRHVLWVLFEPTEVEERRTQRKDSFLSAASIEDDLQIVLDKSEYILMTHPEEFAVSLIEQLEKCRILDKNLSRLRIIYRLLIKCREIYIGENKK